MRTIELEAAAALAALSLMACAGEGSGASGGGRQPGPDGGGSGGGAGSEPGSGGSAGGSGGSGGGSIGGAPCTAVSSPLAIGTGKGTTPSVAWSHDRYALAWLDLEGKDTGIRIAVLDEEGKSLGQATLSEDGANARLPTVRAYGDGFLVAWEEHDGADVVLRARKATKKGAAEGDAWTLATSSGDEARVALGVVDDGAAVAWMSPTAAFVGWLGEAGEQVQDTVELEGGRYPGLGACDAGNLGVAWSKSNKVGFAPLSTGSSVELGGVTWVREAAGHAALPRAACAGGRWAVAWEDVRGDAEVVYVAGVGGDGSSTGEVAVPSAGGSANWPDVVWMGGDRLAVVYYQFRGGPASVFVSVFDAKLDRVGDELRLTTGAMSRFPSMTWTGAELGVAWAESDGPVRFARLRCP